MSSQEYRAANRLILAEKQRSYYAAHKDERKTYSRANKGIINEKRRARYAADEEYREKQKANARQSRGNRLHQARQYDVDRYRDGRHPNGPWNPERAHRYYLEHRQEQIAYARRWQSANPDRSRENKRRSRAKRLGALCSHWGCLTLGPMALAWQMNPHVCYICGSRVWQGVNLNMDHVVPLSRGGLHCAENIRPACESCNRAKWAHPLEVFLSTAVPV